MDCFNNSFKNIKSIVVLTGAGISAESGIKTFRDSNGLWEKHRIEDVATLEGFIKDPNLVYQFYNKRRQQLWDQTVQPNAAHEILVTLEKKFKDNFLLITQNVDNLHSRAGSKNLIHMHGELMKMRCQRTGIIYDSPIELNYKNTCECCELAGNLRPHIVWFGEAPLMMDEIYNSLEKCDLFLAIGTSGNVYPAAGFVQVAKENANCLAVEFNKEQTPISNYFDYKEQGSASETLNKFIKENFSL